MARNDVYLNINALSPADAVVTGQQDMTAATVPELVLGDTPTFNFYFTDNTNVWPSWAGNASYTLTWALSDAVAGDFSPAATTGNATPITGGWSVLLPLNSYDLVGLLNTKRVGQPYPVTNLWQQLRVTDPSGNEVTRAMFWTPVRYRAISDTQNTESASPTGGRFVAVNNLNALTTPTAAQFYAANPVPTSALGSAANGELLIGNGTGFTKATLTAGSGVSITNGSGSITISATDGDITLDDGTAAAPSLKFTADTDTGLYRPAANTLGVAVGGAQIAYFDANGITTVGAGATFDGSVHAANGNANNPSLSFTSDDNTGFFRHQPDEIGISLGGTQTGTLTAALATLTSKLLVSSGATTTAATDLLINPAVKASGNLLDLQVASSSKFSVSSAGNGTFGGNLTVSGTGGVNVASNTKFWALNQAAYYYIPQSGSNTGDLDAVNGIRLLKGGTAVLTAGNSTDGNVTVTNNLTVSGGTITGGTSGLSLASGGTNQNITLTPSGTGALRANLATSATAFEITNNNNISFRLNRTGVANPGAGGLSLASSGALTAFADGDLSLSVNGSTSSTAVFLAYGPGTTPVANTLVLRDGCTLLGTTTNSGNGKLQLATHTTSAGGIGFGTDTTLYRAATGNLVFGTSGTALLFFQGAGSGIYLSSTGGSFAAGMVESSSGLILRAGSTTALTLDSSQNATFAGNITIDKATPAILVKRGANTQNGQVQFATGASGDFAIGSRGTSDSDLHIYNYGTAADSVTISKNTSAVTFAGSIAIGNTVQTAASVASTHKVTISIGGVTYYLLATNI